MPATVAGWTLRALVAVAALALGLAHGPVQAAASPEAAPLRYRIELQGPKELTGMLKEGLKLSRWQHDPGMTPELLERLLEESVRDAREAAATEGYFSAAVRGAIDRGSDPWIVTLTVDPGPRTTVDRVDIRVSGPAADDAEARGVIDRIRARWSLAAGQPFRQEAWESAKRDAVRELSEWRYAAARVAASRAEIDPQSRSAALTVELASGPPFRFGPLQVSGTKRYSQRLVENLDPIRPGDVYERKALATYQRRLLETGYFVSAQVDVDPEAPDPGAAPVRVALIEGSRQHVEAGVSYSTDAGQRLELRYNNMDTLGSASRFKSDLQLDRKIQQLNLNLDSPPLSEARWNSGFARARRTDIQNQQTAEAAVGVSHNWLSGGTPSGLELSAHTEDQKVADVPDQRSHAIYLAFRRTFRDTDDVVAPRSGVLANWEVGAAPAALATRGFARATAGASYFFPVARNDDLLLRAYGGVVRAAARDGIPSTFLFRTGGDQTVRGYAFESLGVKQGDAVVGGRYVAVTSVEETHWFGASWGVAAFVDAGNAWDRGTPFHAAVGYGTGARFRTPVGPIRIDLAYGRDTRKVRLHFSAGFTF
ncbi:MAG TPA: BamA/TamA family outer membrane protein [Burkholderiales bacterium]|nr:BamA/TamA family outer membrane protein [Burkholderiales bacterium]